MDKYATGLCGEVIAREFLENKKYKIIDTNVSFHNIGEIDLVAEDGDTLVFVEVRTRADNKFGNPLETLTPSKRKKIVAASRRYLMQSNKNTYSAYRYDVIGIIHDSITHIENAFYAYW